MKKFLNLNKIIILLLVIVLGITFTTVYAYSQASNEKLLNNITEIDADIYVQHDTNNSDIYLLNSEGKETTIYKIINVTYTAGKQWTRDGLYIDDATGKIGATSPEDYISVKEDEVYFVRLYGIGEVYKGENGDEWHITTPIVYFDDSGNCVGHALSSTVSASKKGVEITIPKGATRMYISNYNNQNISIQKKIILNESEFKEIKTKQEQILNHIDNNYNNFKSDPVIYSELDKGYITFVNDDSKPNVDKFADLFISKDIPLCYAAVADNLLNNASNLKETRLDVAHRVQKAGGEILAHNAPVITADTINDNNFMYNYFVTQKQLLTSMGLNVNGIILAGGTGQITGSPITAKWTSALYKYSDLLGEKYNTSLGIDSVYYHARGGLGNYNNDIEKLKADIDQTITQKNWKVFYFHDTNEVSLETLEAILDYINTKSKDDLEVVTYDTMYQKFASRESTIKNNKKTYYVSSDGTSKDGTDINNPINLETLNTKKIKTGDTILFKSGDTFFGTLNLSVAKVDDKYVTISNYGRGYLPTISTYKYISNAWEKYSDNIYRIDIKNNDNFTGYKNDDSLSLNVGFIEDDNENKYYNKKPSIDSLNSIYDFYSDGSRYLYLYIDSNPYEKLGNLKVVVRSNLMNLSSNMKVSNLRFSYTGGHAIEGSSTYEENIIISNCIIENIGGSYLYSSSLTNDTRYGNGIEFYGSNAKNITINNNIFRNIYDVAFTIQGTSGSGTDIYVYDNVFINNTQDSEIWENDKATGVYNYRFYNNLSINQGRGWGYEARPDKYPAASILFWGYEINNTDISFTNNTLYNPRQIYYFAEATNNYFLSSNTIKSDNNKYYMSEDTTIYRNNWNYNTKDEFIKTYQVDENSIYNLVVPDLSITEQANKLTNINRIRMLVLNKQDIIKSIELINIPKCLKIEKGQSINLEDISLKINYFDGLNDIINIDNSMLSNIDYQKTGTQVITVSYLGYTTTFNLEIIDEQKQPSVDNENNSDTNTGNTVEDNNNLNDNNNLDDNKTDINSSIIDKPNNNTDDKINNTINKEQDIDNNDEVITKDDNIINEGKNEELIDNSDINKNENQDSNIIKDVDTNNKKEPATNNLSFIFIGIAVIITSTLIFLKKK